MSADNPPFPGDPISNQQASRPPGEGDPVEAEVVETGDRRREVHYETATDHEVVARHLVHPSGPLPPQGDSPGAIAADADTPPIEDVAVAPESSSVWDARPPADDAGKSGNPTGH